MKTNIIQRMILYLFIISLVYSCSDPFKNKYAGKWIEVKNEIDTISIDKNNEDYIVTYEGKRLPAIYKDRNLEVTIGGLKPTMMLDEQTDRILFLEKEYIRFEKSFTSRICGIWQLKTEGSYLKITKDSYGRFVFNEGYKNEGYTEIYWPETMLEYGDAIYLKPLDGKLKGSFVSYNFRPTHGQPFTYNITIEITSDDKLLYNMDNNVIEATKISN